jgi:hypothetical protein
MGKYYIPIVWQSYKRIEVEAEDLHSAIYQALKQFLSEPDDNYICDSFEIDSIIEEETGEEYNLDDILNNL